MNIEMLVEIINNYRNWRHRTHHTSPGCSDLNHIRSFLQHYYVIKCCYLQKHRQSDQHCGAVKQQEQLIVTRCKLHCWWWWQDGAHTSHRLWQGRTHRTNYLPTATVANLGSGIIWYYALLDKYLHPVNNIGQSLVVSHLICFSQQLPSNISNCSDAELNMFVSFVVATILFLSSCINCGNIPEESLTTSEQSSVNTFWGAQCQIGKNLILMEFSKMVTAF